MSFWQQLPQPFFAMAPMADVTDAAFRRVMAKYSKTDASAPYVTWTEFVAADGLARAPEAGRQKLLADFIYDKSERPVVAQLFSATPEHMEAAAALCRELGFNGIDINMGCPVGNIVKQGCGAQMIRTPEIAVAVIQAAKRGAGDLPVSVKTRLGYHEDEVETWIPTLLRENLAALTVHCRTRSDMSKVPARWERLRRIRELRDIIAPETILIGNGDVLSQADGLEKATQTGVEGIMVGRALFGNPWFFHPTKQLPHRLKTLPTSGVNRDEIVEAAPEESGIEYITLKERLAVLVEHTQLFTELLPHKNFNIMKKHCKGYINGFPDAAVLRSRLMECSSVPQVAAVVEQFLSQ